MKPKSKDKQVGRMVDLQAKSQTLQTFESWICQI